MVRVKLRRSEGSGKCVFIVEGKSSSVRSVMEAKDIECEPHDSNSRARTFLHSNLGGTRLRLLLSRGILVLLHAPYLCDPVSIGTDN